MEFTLEAIMEAHSKYSGVEFPKLIHEFKLMGIIKNEYNVEDGRSIYVDQSGKVLEIEGKRLVILVNSISDKGEVKKILKDHQAGKSDFVTFCNEVAEAGVFKWITKLDAMTCDYYDLNNNLLLSEEIPVV